MTFHIFLQKILFWRSLKWLCRKREGWLAFILQKIDETTTFDLEWELSYVKRLWSMRIMTCKRQKSSLFKIVHARVTWGWYPSGICACTYPCQGTRTRDNTTHWNDILALSLPEVNNIFDGEKLSREGESGEREKKFPDCNLKKKLSTCRKKLYIQQPSPPLIASITAAIARCAVKKALKLHFP